MHIANTLLFICFRHHNRPSGCICSNACGFGADLHHALNHHGTPRLFLD